MLQGITTFNRCARRMRLESLENRLVLEGSLTITEFVASNTLGLEDEDGNRPDWIEVFNTANTDVNLDGWYLTDDANNLTKWQFPQRVLPSNEYEIVHASGKDRKAESQPLHTNFRLSAAGEYLALVRPDGVTIESQFHFPRQQSDISFGQPQATVGAVMVSGQSIARMLVPTQENGGAELGVDWTRADFDDEPWQEVSASVGFDTRDDLPSEISTNIEHEMFDVSSGVYLRIQFLADASSVLDLQLVLQYDDGFVAYVNGTEVARKNAPEVLTYEASARASHSADEAEVVDLSSAIDQLRDGTNILAIHGLNSRAKNSDFIMHPTLLASFAGMVEEMPTGRFFETPSPGRPNGLFSFRHGIVEAPTVSAARGFYDAPIEVTIAASEPGASVSYTTDGSLPTSTNGNLVAATAEDVPPSVRIVVDDTTTLRAATIKVDHVPSRVTTRTFIFLDDVIRQSPNGERPEGWPRNTAPQLMNYGMDPEVVGDPVYGPLLREALLQISTISLVTDINNLLDRDTGNYANAIEAASDSRAWERPVSVELLHPDGAEGFQIDAGLRVRGGVSRADNNSKHSLRLVFRGEYGATKLRYPMFGNEGVEEFDNIDLRTEQAPSWHWCQPRATALDGACEYHTFLRDVFSRDTQRDVGQPYTRSRFYHLYINGQYWGIYQSQERTDNSYGQSYFGGDKDDWEVVKERNHPDGVEATDGDLTAWRQLWEETFNGPPDDQTYFRLQGQNVDGQRNPEYPVLLDMDNLIDYMLITFYTGNLDAPVSNFTDNESSANWRTIRRRDGELGFQFFIFDAEWALVHEDDNRLGPFPAGETFDQSGPQWLHQWLIQSPQYRQQFADRAHKHFFNGGAMTPANSLARLQDRIGQIDQAIIAESARWGDVWSSTPYTKEDWEAAVQKIVDIIPQRTHIVVDQLRNAQLADGQAAPLYPSIDAPAFNRHGGTVPAGFELSITGPGEIFFTLDGSDPRASQLPSVQRYTQPISLVQGGTVRALALLNAEWSAVNEATFSLAESFSAVGDSNRDGKFDRTDIVLVLQSGKYSTGADATFAEGDWNDDGIFNRLDIVAALQSGTYE